MEPETGKTLYYCCVTMSGDGTATNCFCEGLYATEAEALDECRDFARMKFPRAVESGAVAHRVPDDLVRRAAAVLP